MPWAPDYAEAAELLDYLRIPGDDAQDAAVLALAITAASRAIDSFAGRQFGSYTGEMTFEAEGTGLVSIADLSAVTEVQVDGTATTDYALLPRNAPVSLDPWTHLRLTARAGAEVTITGTWGWTSVPDTVKNATLLQASRLVGRRDSPYGIAGSPEAGEQIRLLARVDPDVEVMLRRYRRIWGAV